MSTERLYKKADRADEIADLDLKDASPQEIISAMYRVWIEAVEMEYANSERGYEDNYQLAVRIVAPFRQRLSGELRTSSMSALCAEEYAGLLFSAVLNTTDMGKLTIDTDGLVGDWGEKLRKGKTVEVAKGIDAGNCAIGNHAEGGKAVNNGHVLTMGKSANAGLFINHGEVKWGLGYDAAGTGIFINKGNCGGLGGLSKRSIFINLGIADSIGYTCNDGLFVDFGRNRQYLTQDYFGQDLIGSTGDHASGGVFVRTDYQPRTERDFGDGAFLPDARNAYGIEKDLDGDERLCEHLYDLQKAAMAENEGGIRHFARKVDKHVRNKYARKVA